MGARDAHLVVSSRARVSRPRQGVAHTHECGTCHAQVVVFIDKCHIVHICPLVQTGDRYRELKEVAR